MLANSPFNHYLSTLFYTLNFSIDYGFPLAAKLQKTFSKKTWYCATHLRKASLYHYQIPPPSQVEIQEVAACRQAIVKALLISAWYSCSVVKSRSSRVPITAGNVVHY
jgi:hypothetical protein